MHSESPAPERPPSALSSTSREKRRPGFLGKLIHRKDPDAPYLHTSSSNQHSQSSIQHAYTIDSLSSTHILRHLGRDREHSAPSPSTAVEPHARGYGRAGSVPSATDATHAAPAQRSASDHTPQSFLLDTNFDDMSGILKAEFLQQPVEGIIGKWHKKTRKAMAAATAPNNARANRNANQNALVPVSPFSMGPSKMLPGRAAGWKPPDSWGVAGATTNGGSSQSGSSTTQPRKLAIKPTSSTYYIRVFQLDSTFCTVPCTLDTTVTELLPLLCRKFFLPVVEHYLIGFRRLGLIRILDETERPLLLQRRMLELSGYTEEDSIADLGREDLGYLCRFLLINAVLPSTLNETDDSITPNGKFTQVDLERKNLVNLPQTLYTHASEIVKINFSGNLSLAVPINFIKLCSNLQEIKFAHNECVHLPESIMAAPKLNYLDISSNRLDDLSSANFENHEALVSLRLQNNCLSSLPYTMVHLRFLRDLSLAFNYLTEFPLSVCNLVTLLRLDMSFNSIRELPSEMGQLCALETLEFTNNLLTGSLPNTFENLTSLKSLDIRYNKLTNIDIVMTLPRLEVFFASHNSVTQLDKSSRRMRIMHMNQNPITYFNFGAPMMTLTTLNLANAKMSSFPPGFFDKITNLEKLVLDNNHFGTLPSQIGKLKRLTSFSCVGNSLSSLPPEIGSLSELQVIDLHRNTLGSLPSELWLLSNLEVLNVSFNYIDSFPLPLYLGSITPDSTLLKPIPSEDTVSVLEDMVPQHRRPSNINLAAQRRSSAVSATSQEHYFSSAPRKTGSFPETPSSSRKDSSASTSVLANTFAQSLKKLYMAGNLLTDQCLKEISFLPELVVLNLSYNRLSEIPVGTIGRLLQLKELYLSGNTLANIPSDDLFGLSNLEILHLNANKLLTLPAELAEIHNLLVLDVGSNSLKYNISNWPYDWNWNYNESLKYLNLSGNKRLEIKPSPQLRTEKDLSDFSSLQKLRVLGLMDITLTSSSIPDETEDRRVRTSGSEVHSMPYGMADTLGRLDHLSYIDMVVERFRGNEEEVIFALLDGQDGETAGGCRVAKFVQEKLPTEFANELRNLRDGEVQVAAALRRTFLSINKQIGIYTTGDSDTSQGSLIGPDDFSLGACATVAYIAGNHLYIANLGDIRAILVRTDREFKLLTTKHEPAFPPEIDRIREAGGYVSQTGKLNNKLEVSRSFGFFDLIPCVQAAPSIFECELSEIDDLLIIASRELWEYVDHQTAVDMAATERNDPMRAAQKLRDFAIAFGCTAKVVVMIVVVGDFGKKSSLSRVKNGSNGGAGAGVTAMIGGSVSSADEEYVFSKPRRTVPQLNYAEDFTWRVGDEVPPPVGELAMAFTDIKNSTKLWETNPVAMRSAIKIHNSIMRRQLRIVGGYEVKTEGDAFMVCFSTVAAAMVWCFSVQSQLLLAEWPPEIISSVDGAEVVDEENNIIYRGLSVRMGVHWGAPVCELDPITRRMDYFGPMVNRASRISTVADGGQIAVSLDFVSEIKRLEEIYKRAEGDFDVLDSVFGGDDMLARAVDRDLKLLHGYGWGIKQLGEMKLKGLENPESISLVYPRSLAARMKIDISDDTASTSGNTTTPSGMLAGMPSTRPLSSSSVALPRATEAIYTFVTKLRGAALRLEQVCSYLDGTVYNEDMRAQQSMVIGHLFAFTDADAFAIVENSITRIENAVARLYVRAALGGGFGGGLGGGGEVGLETGRAAEEGKRTIMELLAEMQRLLV
ncbi:phosphatase 2C-domain-containing protein [Limtongia smithiae]|uniref:phosphatase 2C-domain-containing protein n=1 Tax=Limtongia smithiae TaxID=1125753 RepID=UPI0034CFEA22